MRHVFMPIAALQTHPCITILPCDSKSPQMAS